MLRSGLQELSSSVAGSKFFSPEWKNVHRNWLNYLADLGGMIEHEEDPGVLAELQQLDKVVNAVRTVLTKVNTVGLANAQTVQAFYAQLAFLAMPPVVPYNPFPPYLTRLMHERSAEEAWPADAFWKKIQASSMAEFAPKQDIGAGQFTFAASKIMFLCQQSDPAEVLEKMDALCKAFFEMSGEELASEFSCQSLRDELSSAQAIVVASSTARASLPSLTKALDDLDAAELLKALDTYPKGRALVSKAKAKKADLESFTQATGKLEQLLAADPLTSQVVSEIDEVLLSMGCVAEGLKKALPLQFLENLKRSLVDEFSHFMMCSKEDRGSSRMRDYMSFLEVALQTKALFDVHEIGSNILALFDEMKTRVALRCLLDEANPDNLTSETATTILLGLGKYSSSCVSQKALVEARGAAQADAMLDWARGVLMGKVGLACQERCKQNAKPVLESAKTMVKMVLAGTTSFPNAVKDLQRLTTFKLEGELPQAMAILGSLPGQHHLALELQFVHLFGSMVLLLAQATIEYQQKPSRSDRKFTDASRRQLSLLRLATKAVKDFIEAHAGEMENLFQEAGSVMDQLTGGKAPVATLGHPLDTSYVQATIDKSRAFAMNIVDDWVKDTEELCSLLVSWAGTEWEPLRDKLLAKENMPVVESMMNNPNYGRAAKAVTVLSEWRALFKTLNNDQGGVVIGVEQMRSWQSVICSSSSYCEMTYALYEIKTKIPAVKNINMRRSAAKLFTEDLRKRGFDVGEMLKNRLKALATGATVEEEQLKDEGGDHGAATSEQRGGEEEANSEPSLKRARVKG